MTENWFNFVQPYEGQRIANTGVYEYPFVLYPNDYEPSGHCNPSPVYAYYILQHKTLEPTVLTDFLSKG